VATVAIRQDDWSGRRLRVHVLRREKLDYETVALVVCGGILFIATFSYMVMTGRPTHRPKRSSAKRRADCSHSIGPFNDDPMGVNPATGLPMADHCIDIGGNVYGAIDQHRLSLNVASSLPVLDSDLDIAGNMSDHFPRIGAIDDDWMGINLETGLPMTDFGIHIGGVVHGEFDQHISFINPASGLPMIDSCVDVAGNAFGQSSPF
jgi:hypothetical protein